MTKAEILPFPGCSELSQLTFAIQQTSGFCKALAILRVLMEYRGLETIEIMAFWYQSGILTEDEYLLLQSFYGVIQ